MSVFSRRGMSTVGERLRRGWWEGVLSVVLLMLLLLLAWGAGGGREVLLLLEVRVVCLPSSHWGGRHGHIGRESRLSIIVVVQDILLVSRCSSGRGRMHCWLLLEGVQS